MGKSSARSDDAAVADAACATLEAALARWRYGIPGPAAARQCVRELTEGSFGRQPRAVDTAAGRFLQRQLSEAWERGWLPADLQQIARRRLAEPAVSLAVDAMAADAARFAPSTIDSRWQAQLAQIGASKWWDAGAPHLGQWAERREVDRGRALATVLALGLLLSTLPRLPRIVPMPGTAAASSQARRDVDEKMLARVRALLAKAESTEYPAEAETLSAKAQELMSRYAIEQAMLEKPLDEVALPGARRMWLDPPYLQAKSALVGVVAAANRCRGVTSLELGFVTLVGDDLDLQLVELLSTSLMVQATSAMVVAGRQTGAYGQSRTRSFRHAFLNAYASRIGERLQTQADETVAAAGAELVPVFAERDRLVDETFEWLFPSTRRSSVSVGNAAGWNAGRAAADAAVLHPAAHDPLVGSA